MFVLKTNNLTKQFHRLTALNKVSITIEQGKIYGFVGNNGAGKTTLMRVICGLIRADSGGIELFGESTPQGLEHAREKVGALIEQPIGYPEMSARQNLRALSLLTKNSSFDEVEELMGLVGISSVARKSIKNYSTGMLKRYGIAAALLGKPELLILDEPLSGVDVEGMDEMSNLLKQIVTKRKVTVLFSSHQLSRLEQIATDYIFIDQGKIIRTADAETITAEASAVGSMEDYFRKLIGGARNA